jgi:hypothetical protein
MLPFAYSKLLIPITRSSQGAARSTDATAYQRTCANIAAGQSTNTSAGACTEQSTGNSASAGGFTARRQP